MFVSVPIGIRRGGVLVVHEHVPRARQVESLGARGGRTERREARQQREATRESAGSAELGLWNQMIRATSG